MCLPQRHRDTELRSICHRDTETQRRFDLRTLFLALAFAVAAMRSSAGWETGDLAEARRVFAIGLTALHNFEYEDANDAFQRARKIDPGFVMAYWGEAMTYYQTLWRHEDVAAARGVLAALAPTPEARAAKARDAREKAYLSAVEVLFGDGDAATRHRAYAEAMGRVHAADPADADVASLYALALLGTMSRSLIGTADEGRSQGLAGSAVQKAVAAILEGVLKTQPTHPGALHYLLHDYDDPEHARLALPAARAYAKIAADSSHALHMPSHIFLQLGLWHDAARSDRAAFDASDRWIKKKGLPPAMRSYHALSWLQYELLQLGRYREARDAIGEIEPVVRASGALTPGAAAGHHNPLLSDLSSMRARFVVETRRWDLMANERNFGNADDLFAIGVSAARSGNAALAGMARQGLADRAQSEQEGDLRPAIAIMEREVAAVIEAAGGRRDRAIEILRTAAKAELELPPPLGVPQPIKAAPELLGEMLLEAGRAAEAVEAFEQGLRRNPNRTLAVLGLARAEKAAGRLDAARRHYRQVQANLDEADEGLAEVKEAREAITVPGRPGGSGRAGR
jgi:tetratricopeptide (TPR) repeat protein